MKNINRPVWANNEALRAQLAALKVRLIETRGHVRSK